MLDKCHTKIVSVESAVYVTKYNTQKQHLILRPDMVLDAVKYFIEELHNDPSFPDKGDCTPLCYASRRLLITVSLLMRIMSLLSLLSWLATANLRPNGQESEEASGSSSKECNQVTQTIDQAETVTDSIIPEKAHQPVLKFPQRSILVLCV